MNQPSPQQEPEPISPELLEGLRHELNRPKSTPAFGDFVTVATILYLTWGVWHEMSGH